jgi:hypothetical protein
MKKPALRPALFFPGRGSNRGHLTAADHFGSWSETFTPFL